MDYRELLKKYIQYIRNCEGIDYLDSSEQHYASDVKFTAEEWAALQKAREESYPED